MSADSLYGQERERLGYGIVSKNGRITKYPVSVDKLHAGWYLNYGWLANPAKPNGMDYVQTIYVATFGWSAYFPHQGLVHPRVQAIAIDDAGDKWFGTAGGVSRFHDGNWTNYTAASSGLIHDTVRAVAVDQDGVVWFGTDGGVCTFDGTTWASYTSAAGLADNRVRDIAVAPDGAIWFATLGGVSVYNGTNWVTYTAADGLPDDRVYAVYPDGDLVWFGTESGLARFDGTWQVYDSSDGLGHDRVQAFSRDGSGNLWAGTAYGAARFNGSAWENHVLTPPNGAEAHDIRAIDRDSLGNLWFASMGGMLKYDGEMWSRWPANGVPDPAKHWRLANNWVNDLVIDDADRKWCATEEAVSVYDEHRAYRRLANAVAANPGAIWCIGSETDGWQEAVAPFVYAQRYHELYTFIKSKDTTARVANAAIVQATPIRMTYMERFWDAYEARYGQGPPVDFWNIHEQILREEYGSWGCSVPFTSVSYTYQSTASGETEWYTKTARLPVFCTNAADEIEYCRYNRHGEVAPEQTRVTEGKLYSVQDNADLGIFKEHIQRFRQWMKDHGEQEKPLMITEYGVIMPDYYLYPPETQTALDFMAGTFRYMLGTVDEDLGQSDDGYRLVQQWAWFSLNSTKDFFSGGYNGPLTHWDPDHDGELTVFGDQYRDFTHNAVPETGTVDPSGGEVIAGIELPITATYSDADGAADIESVYLMINSSKSQEEAVLVRYDLDTNLCYLRDRSDTTWMPSGGLVMGSGGSASNAHATLQAGDSSVQINGNTVSVTWSLVFKASMVDVGLWQYLKVKDSYGMFDGWDQAGYLNRPNLGGPTTVAASLPAAGWSEPDEVVALTTSYSDPDGWADLHYVELLVSDTAASTIDAVRLRYDVQLDLFFLQDRWQEDVWIPVDGATPGSDENMKQGLVRFYPEASYVTKDTKTLTVNWVLAFSQLFGGLHNVYLLAQDMSTLTDGWNMHGEWRVQNTPEPVYFGQAGDTIGVDDRIRYGMSYRDPDGIPDMAQLYLLITDTAPSDAMPGLATSEGAYAGAALLRYDVQQDRMYLRNIMDTKWKPADGIIPQTKAKEKWPHAILRGVKSWTEAVTDKALYVRYNLQLRASLAGENRVWMRAVDVHGANRNGDSGWLDMGTLSVGNPEDFPQAINLSPDTGIGLAEEVVIFEAVYDDRNGWNDLDHVELLFSDSASQTTDAVRVRYDVQGNAFYLQDRWQEGVWEGGVAPGSADPIEHGLVTVYPDLSSVATDGEQLTVRYALGFKTTFGGLHQGYLRAKDQAGQSSGWVQRGRWRVQNTPEPVYFGQAGDTIGVDDRIRYGMSYRDADGIEDMAQLYLLITDTAPSDLLPGLATSEGAYAGAALLRYDVQQDRMYLRNIMDTKWKPAGGIVPETKEKEKWPHAILRGVKSWTEAVTDNALYVRYNLQLREPLAGENRIWMRAIDVHGQAKGGDSGWLDMGTLTITP